MRRMICLGVVLAWSILAPHGAGAQQRGAIAGRVATQAGGQPLAGATVTVGGTALRAVTDQAGAYRIANVPAGTHDVTATILGYAPRSQRVTVAAGETADAAFALEASALEIGGLVVTASGREQRRRELGNAVGSIDVSEVNLAPVSDFSQLVQGRVAGTTVLQSSGTTGGGSRIRIRGSNSISLNNSPLLIVDGVRVDDAATGENVLGFGVGGQEPSALNDINPEDIENVEILKGPAAAALYGTAAANGVIQITTKRGRAGSPQFRFWTEYGTLEQPTRFPDNVTARGTLVPGSGVTNVAPGTLGRCDNIRRAIGSTPGPSEIGCSAVTETFRYNPLENPATAPFQDGNRRSVGGSVSGGGQEATFYVSGEYEDETGVLPQNDLRRVRVQASLTGNVGSSLTVGAKAGFVESDLQLPQSDNALFGILPMGLQGSPLPANVETNGGFANDPAFFYDWKTFQDLSRFTGSVRADWRPLAWLSANANAGLDRAARLEVNRLPRENAYGVFGPPFDAGFIQNYDYDIYNASANGSATAVFPVGDDLVSTTSLGSQYLRETLRRLYAFGAGLTPGIETSLGGATSDFSAFEQNALNATVSAYAQQQLAWRDRLFLNLAARGDQNTAFGADIGWIWYPSASVSWVLSEEPFFPQAAWMSNLRLRAAYGQSGLRPGPDDALQSFAPTVATFQSTDLPGFIVNQVGNPDLKPERSTEWEMGVEAGFLDERIGFQATYFDKTSRDALVARPLPPSLGASQQRFENLGRVDNRGLELVLNAQPLRRESLQWGLTLTGSWIRNELVDLGSDAQGNPIPPIIFGLNVDTQRHAEGYPLGAWFQRPVVSFADANGDGLL
ncbi:MAG TPA: SusC/RagA family TonB-linked outer membrane protein, partial [Longimicrobiaceae bacterium]|nr:SusC/RagA family TonB-linked outer membrane protein [Longimicrobiaceae bacterium]